MNRKQNTMLERQDFEELATIIVRAHFPSEERAFLLMKDTLIGDILMDINPTTFYYKQDHDQGAFHRISPGSVIEALKYVTVLWSTYKMIKEIFVEYQKLKNNPKEVQIQAIQDAWTVHLAQAQLTSENSRLIAKEHAAHVLTLLDKKYGC